MITAEPFTGHFTGNLSTVISNEGIRYVFKTPLPRIEKGAPYILKINTETKTARLVPVVLPHPDAR